jgi:hypothetical protein
MYADALLQDPAAVSAVRAKLACFISRVLTRGFSRVMVRKSQGGALILRKFERSDRTRISPGADEDRPYTIPFPQAVDELVEILGAVLTATVANVGETRRVKMWIDAQESPPARRQQILRFALQVAQIIHSRYGREIAQSWFQGLNRHLQDEVPALLLHDLNSAEKHKFLDTVDAEKRILAAARNFAER